MAINNKNDQITVITLSKINRKTTRQIYNQCNSNKVACKRQSSVNSGAWLRRFDDITRVENSCIALQKTEKSEGKMLCHCNLRLPVKGGAP